MKRVLSLAVIAIVLSMPVLAVAVGPLDGAYSVTATSSNGQFLDYVVVVQNGTQIVLTILYPDVGSWFYGIGTLNGNTGSGALLRAKQYELRQLQCHPGHGWFPVRDPDGHRPDGEPERLSDFLGAHQNSMRAPSSTTRLGGSSKKSATDPVLRAMSAKSRLRHRIMRPGPVGRNCTRLK